MALCAPRQCGCAIQSSTLSIEGSGTGDDPWIIEQALAGDELPVYSFADETDRDLSLPSPSEGQQAWIRSLDTLQFYDGTDWLVLEEPWQDYTPTLGGSGWSLGAGTADGRFKRIGKLVHFHVLFVFGAGMTASTSPTCTLPLTAATTGPGFDSQSGNRNAVQSSYSQAGVAYSGMVYFDNTTTLVLQQLAVMGNNVRGELVTSTEPFTWASGDVINLWGVYEIA